MVNADTQVVGPLFSVIIPCFNEEAVLPIFFQEIIPPLEKVTNGSWEIICIDDGSTDHTPRIIADLNQYDRRICGIMLSRNFGHQPALNCGLAYASGQYLGVMDCDLQDPVEILLEMFHKVSQEGYDVAYGVRRKRQAPALLRLFYKAFYRFINAASDHPWPVDAGDFSVFKRCVLTTLLSMPESIRMLRGLRSFVGFRQIGIPYDRPERKLGRSKYNLFKLLALATTAFVGFSSIPLRLATFIGLSMGCLTLVIALILLINRFFPGFSIFGYYIGANPGTTTIVLYLSFIASMLFFSLGIIGEYLAVLIKETKRRPTAVIMDFIGRLKEQSPSYNIINATHDKGIRDG